MGSYFQDNPPTPEEIAKWRADLTRGWPYTEDDPEPDFFDWTPDPDRSATTDSIYLLKATGNWTAEDERIAFDPSKPPPRPLAELEAERKISAQPPVILGGALIIPAGLLARL